MTTIRTRLVAAAMVTSTLPLVAALPAHAGGAEKIERGSCSGNTTWKLKAKADDDRIEVEGEVDSNVSGQTWRFVLKHNGNVVARVRKQTAGPSGSFDVTRHVNDATGTDAFKLRAKNPRTDEVCVGRLSF